MEEEETGQERRKSGDQCEVGRGRKFEKKLIGLCLQFGIGIVFRPHLEKAFSKDRITMNRIREAKPAEQLFRFCYQTPPSSGPASNGICYDLTKALRVAAGVRHYHHILDVGPYSCG